MKRIVVGLLSTFFLTIGPVVAQADIPLKKERDHVQQDYVARSVVAEPARPGCIRACDFDDNPCDPSSFKIADGRCSGD